MEKSQPIAIAVSQFWPEQTGVSQTTAEFCWFVADRGHTVKVATSFPFYPQWSIWPEYRGKVWMRQEERGVTVFRSWHFVRPNPSAITRILHEATLSLFSLPTIVKATFGARVLYVTSPALSFAFVSILTAKVLRVPSVLYVQDIQPDAAVELGMLKNPMVIAASKWLARRIYGMAGKIYTIGDGMRRRILRDAGGRTDVQVVPNTIDPTELEPVPSNNEFRRRFVQPFTFAVIHSGNMGKKQDLPLILRAAALMRRDSTVHFFVFGDGAVKNDFLRRRTTEKLNNISHFPLQERSMLRHMLSGADVVLISQLPEVIDIVVPSKLLTALAAGAMIVAACHPESEAARLIHASEGGIVVPPSDENALVNALRDVQNGNIDIEAYRANARRFAVDNFSRNIVYGRVLQELDES